MTRPGPQGLLPGAPPATGCEHQRPGQPPCGSTTGLVRLFIGWVCRTHALPGAQVYAVAPLPGAPLTGPGLVVADDGSLRAPGIGRHPDDAPRVAADQPLAPVRRLPDPARAAAAVHADATGAEAQAAVLAMGRTGKPRRRLLEHLATLGAQGATSTEAWRWYCTTHGPIDLYTVRPRLTELKRDGWLIDSGRVRRPRSDGSSDAPAEEVLVLSDRGRAQLAAQAGAR